MVKLVHEGLRQTANCRTKIKLMPAEQRPTDVELRILNVFWEQGPSTVRQVHNTIIEAADRRDTAYSTTLKMIQVLHGKGLLGRDESVRPQVYHPTVTREDTQRHYIRDVAQRLFGGAMSEIVQCAISSDDVTEADLAEMQRLIRTAKQQKKAQGK